MSVTGHMLRRPSPTFQDSPEQQAKRLLKGASHHTILKTARNLQEIAHSTKKPNFKQFQTCHGLP
eukprot:1573762-Amphidinium_carterae.1